MAKAPASALGIDMGGHTWKAVHLQRRSGGRVVLSGFATRLVESTQLGVEQVAHHLKLLAVEAGGAPKAASACFGGEGTLLRIIEQPPTPIDVLRGALRYSAQALLHQDCADHVLDCDAIPGGAVGGDSMGAAAQPQHRYLVAGAPRARVQEVGDAFERSKLPLRRLQLSPVALFNAFEFARPQVFRDEPFVLLDLGHTTSTVIAGMRGGITLVRAIGYGGDVLLKELTMDGAMDRASAMMLMQEGDAGMAQAARESLAMVAREVLGSIGFSEGQWDRPAGKVFVSGGAAHAEMVLQVLSDEVNLPCELWSPFERCESALPAGRRPSFESESWNLNVAFGAAVELLETA
jgi:Tfp pilus assembly PilM family ATPase